MRETPAALSKKARTVAWFNRHASFLMQCPHCQESLTFQNGLHCQNGHQFDMNKQGAFFLAKKAVDTKYDTALFQARRAIILESPLYRALHQTLQQLLEQHEKVVNRSLTIVDAGCGEASHLHRVSQTLQKPTCVALDLSKAGIQQATDYNGDLLAIVADLAHLPIADSQVDVILSLLSPANYDAFRRVLKDDGIIIKVIPNENYLRELRQVALLENSAYSNEQIRHVFQKNFCLVDEISVFNQVELTRQQLDHLMKMTPLTWQLSEHQQQAVLEQLSTTISLDMSILIGKKY